MKKTMLKKIAGAVVSAVTVAVLSLSSLFATVSFAGEQYNNDYDLDGNITFFDLSTNIMDIKAGETGQVTLYAHYNYTYYIKGATSKSTYCDCTWKAGTSKPVFHIGADETPNKSVYFYFYVDDDRFTRPEDNDVFMTMEIRVKPGAQSVVPTSVTASDSVKLADKTDGKFGLISNDTVGMLYDNKGGEIAAFSISDGGKTMPTLKYGGVAVIEGKNYFVINTKYSRADTVKISETDKAQMVKKGYAGVYLNGIIKAWP